MVSEAIWHFYFRHERLIQRIPNLIDARAERQLPPWRGGTLALWVINPFSKFMTQNGSVSHPLKLGLIATLKRCHAICLQTRLRTRNCVIPQNAAVARKGWVTLSHCSVVEKEKNETVRGNPQLPH